MPRNLTLLITIVFIIYLFRRDSRERLHVTSALWIPLVWMLIIGTRFVSQWLELGSQYSSVALEEGSPLDRWLFTILIAAGVYVLYKRQVILSQIFRNNRWLTLYFLYCFFAIFWSDLPFVAFKRWIKALGEPIMVLILVTEPEPAEALIRLMKRFAYLVVPLSIVLIKYFPELGRTFSQWTGQAQNMGVTLSKNALGHDCMVLGIFFFWYLLKTLKLQKSKARRDELLLIIGFLCMIWWLISMANSSTSLTSLIVGVLVVALLGLRFVSKRFIGTYVLAGIVILLGADLAFGLITHLIGFLGKDSTLTGRTELWQVILEIKINPIFGTGFESFWLGERLEHVWQYYWWKPSHAHNGYLETYLNLGIIGLFILIGLIVASFRKSGLELLSTFESGRLGLGLLAAIVVYNWTESAFKPLSFVCFVFYLIVVDYHTRQSHPVERSSDFARSEEESKLVYAQETT